MNSSNSVAALVRRVLKGEHTSTDLGTLIDRLGRSESLDPLMTLLNDPKGGTVADGLYILSELGSAGAPLTSQSARFISHPNENVRFFSISCIAAAPNVAPSEAILKILELQIDPSARVRWKAIDFAARVNQGALMKAAELAETCTTNRVEHKRGIYLLLNASPAISHEILSSLRSTNALDRAYGAAASARLLACGRDLIGAASTSADETITDFARSLVGE